MTVQPIFPATPFLPTEPPVAPCARPVLRRRALCVGESAASWVRAPLAATVEDCAIFADPYSAMTVLTDDPTDWLLCVIDADVFLNARGAHDFLRILRFEAPHVPVILANAPGLETCAANLVLAGFDDDGARAVLDIAETKARQRGTLAG